MLGAIARRAVASTTTRGRVRARREASDATTRRREGAASGWMIRPVMDAIARRAETRRDAMRRAVMTDAVCVCFYRCAIGCGAGDANVFSGERDG